MRTDASLALGDPRLDREHDELLRRVIALRDAPEGGERSALEVVLIHAAEHFAREDDDLRRVGSHNAKCHVDEHAAVLRSLEQVAEVLDGTSSDPTGGRRLVAQLAQALLDWLPEHVHQMDAGVADLRTKQRLGGSTIQFVPKLPG